MVAQSAFGTHLNSDTLSLVDGVAATNPFDGFASSAQAITIAGQNALLQSAVTLKDFTSTYVRFKPPSEHQTCVYGDTDSIMCSTEVCGYLALALHLYGLDACSAVVDSVEKFSHKAAAYFNRRYEVRKGQASKLEHEICLLFSIFTTRKMYLSVILKKDAVVPTIDASVPPRELLFTLRQFEKRVNDICAINKIRGYIGIKRSTERYISSTQLTLLKLLCIDERELAFTYLWVVLRALAYQRFPLFALAHNVRRKKKEYETGKLNVVLQNWRSLLPVGGTLSMVMISTLSRPRSKKQASDSLVPVSVALKQKWQPDTSYYIDKLLKTVVKTCVGIATEKEVLERVYSKAKQAALTVMASTVEKKAAPPGSVMNFFSKSSSAVRKPRCAICFNPCAAVGDVLCAIHGGSEEASTRQHLRQQLDACREEEKELLEGCYTCVTGRPFDSSKPNPGLECESVACPVFQNRSTLNAAQGVSFRIIVYLCAPNFTLQLSCWILKI